VYLTGFSNGATFGHEWPKLGPYNTSVEVWRFVSRYRRSVG
jgi:hypothetical protein